MSMTDPVADLLTRLRNASMARHNSVAIPHSTLKHSIVGILKDEGFIRDFRVRETDGLRELEVTLSYDHNKQAVIRGLRRVSTPGCRIYVGKKNLPRIRNGLGIAIVSTSRGVMSDGQARAAGVGGEYLCEVW
ncbi:MAG: 30S ribosomal protein S8 [Myxococcota bacterium]|jgi:small subunit ribosomal protein S8